MRLQYGLAVQIVRLDDVHRLVHVLLLQVQRVHTVPDRNRHCVVLDYLLAIVVLVVVGMLNRRLLLLLDVARVLEVVVQRLLLHLRGNLLRLLLLLLLLHVARVLEVVVQRLLLHLRGNLLRLLLLLLLLLLERKANDLDKYSVPIHNVSPFPLTELSGLWLCSITWELFSLGVSNLPLLKRP